MENFTFYSPTKFVFGKGTEAEAGKLSGFVTLNEDDCTKIYQAMI